MSFQMPTTEPAGIISGDTIQFLISLADYPSSDGWVLHYTLVGSAGAPITWNGISSGSGHQITVSASTSGAYPAGLYTATKYVTKTATGERYTLGQIPITIHPDLAAATTATDTRSHAQKVLDAIEAVIEGRAKSGDQEITIDGTRLVNMTVDQLLKLRSTYAAAVWRERNPGKLAPQVNMHFRGRYGR